MVMIQIQIMVATREYQYSEEEGEEDEQTAKGTVVTPVTTEGDDPRATQTLNPGEAIGDDTAETQEDRMVTMMTRNLQPLETAPFRMIVQRIIRVHLLTFSNLVGQNELSKIFFPTTVTCLDGSIAKGGKFLSCK